MFSEEPGVLLHDVGRLKCPARRLRRVRERNIVIGIGVTLAPAREEALPYVLSHTRLFPV